ncbi:MAG: 1-acyl-sn-glycerol-3-phosphate acyltransferase [Candidatus Omnitrophica bacterium]|nr:1-acyl-sn-glycerol-3-phosphate acyltransferase [Candidatus Omnitrophota bacterium]
MENRSADRPWVYYTVKIVLYTLYKLFFWFGSRNGSVVDALPRTEGVIIAPNHASYLDPPIIGISLGRRVTFLAKEYLFKAPVVGFVLRSISAFPIKSQKDDLRSLRELIRVLKNGACVVVFPEGTRSENGELKDPEIGVGFLALKSAAWVVPAYISGTYRAFPKGVKFFRPAKVDIRYGRPFRPAEDPAITGSADPYRATVDRIMDEVRRLRTEASARQV